MIDISVFHFFPLFCTCANKDIYTAAADTCHVTSVFLLHSIRVLRTNYKSIVRLPTASPMSVQASWGGGGGGGRERDDCAESHFIVCLLERRLDRPKARKISRNGQRFRTFIRKSQSITSSGSRFEDRSLILMTSATQLLLHTHHKVADDG
jgi:hypothetical protein